MNHTTIYAGIDVSQRRLDAALRPTGEHFGVRNDDVGIDELVGQLKETRPVVVVVLEATGGGFERPAAAALAAAGLAVAVVDPRQARHFARATGRLAKTERIDAESLARFAEAVRAQPRTVPHKEARDLAAILARRRQIVEMLTAQNNRLGTAPKAVRKRIEAHVRWLRKELERTDDDLDEAIRKSPTWRENAALLRSVAGVGAVSCAGRFWPNYPNWEASRIRSYARSWGLRPSTETPARCEADARYGAG